MRGISVRILSRRFSPLAMESALNEFFTSQRTLLTRELTDEAVRDRSAAIIRSLEDPPTTFSEEASEHWDSIVHDMPFDWTQQVVAELRTFDKQMVLQAAEQWLFNATTRSSISMMIFSPEWEAQRQQLIAQHRQGHGQVAESNQGLSDAADSPQVAEKEEEKKVPPTSSFGPTGRVSYHFTSDEMTALRDSLPLAKSPAVK